jgi:membrane protein implicated in regulation of membrane protease activity
MNKGLQQPDQAPGNVPARPGGTARRVALTVVIVAAAFFLMVLPWIFLFQSPEQFAGWAASGVILAVALHLFLNTRKRRRALENMLDEDEDDDTSPP